MEPIKFSILAQEATNEETTSDRLAELAQLNVELARLVASNSAADPDLLTELAKNSDRITRKNVAANPNTPTSMLLKLGYEFPAQLLSNPILPLLLIERPNFLHEIPHFELVVLLRYHAEVGSKFDVEVPEDIVAIPEFCLENLARHTNVLIRALVGKNPCSPASLQEKLAADSNYIIRENVAANPSASVELLQKLAQDRSWQVRGNVGLNQKTPIHILESLALDRDRYVRKKVASNPSTPKHLFKKLSQDQSAYVRVSVAENPQTPLEILKELANDPEWDVRNRAKYHSNFKDQKP